MKRESLFIPCIFLAGLIGLIVLIATTRLFRPVMYFIHSPAGELWQLALCVAAGFAGLWASFFLLDTICGHYSLRFDRREKEQGKKQDQGH